MEASSAIQSDYGLGAITIAHVDNLEMEHRILLERIDSNAAFTLFSKNTL
jgi:hypothetical protein